MIFLFMGIVRDNLLMQFLEPRSRLEGSYKVGSARPSICLSVYCSVRPSFRLSVSFLGIDSLVFSET